MNSDEKKEDWLFKRRLANAREAWFADEELFFRIYRYGFRGYQKKLPELKKAFGLRDQCVRCVDEGLLGGIRLAGSGILLDKDRAVEILRESGVQGIYSHAHCGAGRIYAELNGLETKNSDFYAQERIKELACEAGIEYSGHIEAKDMVRPVNFHIARVCYYDGTGRFDHSVPVGLPLGFVVNRRLLQRDEALREAWAISGIALGLNNFGPFIDSDQPFLVVMVCSRSSEQGEIDQNEMRTELSNLVRHHGGKVKLDCLVEP